MSQNTRRRWTPDEDKILLERGTQSIVESKQSESAISWIAVSNAIPGRSNKDCRKRWAKLRGAKRGVWSQSEDERLLKCVEEHGTQWTLVANAVETRNAEQCAKRWQHCLDPSLDHSDWTNEEDQLLIAAIQRNGKQWKEIRSLVFPNRSTTNLSNRYVALTRQSNKSRSASNDLGATHHSDQSLPNDDDTMLDEGDDFSPESDTNDNALGLLTFPPTAAWDTAERTVADSWQAEMMSATADSQPFPFPPDWHSATQLGQIGSGTHDFQPGFPPLDADTGTVVGPSDRAGNLQALGSAGSHIDFRLTSNSNNVFAETLNAVPLANTQALMSGAQPEPAGPSHSVLPRRLQVVMTIDNPSQETVMSILEILTKAKTGVHISMDA